tara:strand:+ start:4437 stop:5228 length:792 start_codon:yes stop_codon:yes gene_type:complete
MTRKRLPCLWLCSLLAIVFAMPAGASHFRFGNHSWRKGSGGLGGLDYTFGDGSIPSTFASRGATLVADLTDVNGEQCEVWTKTVTHTYPSNGVYAISDDSGNRIGNLENAGNDGDLFSVRMATALESEIPSVATIGSTPLAVTPAPLDFIIELVDGLTSSAPACTSPTQTTYNAEAGSPFSLQVVATDPEGNDIEIDVIRPAGSSIIPAANTVTNSPATLTVSTNGSTQRATISPAPGPPSIDSANRAHPNPRQTCTNSSFIS